MKFIALFIGLFLTTKVLAQSATEMHPITKDSFKVSLVIVKNQTLKVLSFVSFKGEKIKAEIIRQGDLSTKEMRPGYQINGIFKFTSFASDGGLGTTRVLKGKGVGDLRDAILIVDDDIDSYTQKLAGVGDMAFRLN